MKRMDAPLRTWATSPSSDAASIGRVTSEARTSASGDGRDDRDLVSWCHPLTGGSVLLVHRDERAGKRRRGCHPADTIEQLLDGRSRRELELERRSPEGVRVAGEQEHGERHVGTSGAATPPGAGCATARKKSPGRGPGPDL